MIDLASLSLSLLHIQSIVGLHRRMHGSNGHDLPHRTRPRKQDEKLPILLCRVRIGQRSKSNCQRHSQCYFRTKEEGRRTTTAQAVEAGGISSVEICGCFLFDVGVCDGESTIAVDCWTFVFLVNVFAYGICSYAGSECTFPILCIDCISY